MVTALRISGMTCSGCVGHVTKALKGVPGVSAVEVSLPDHARVVHDDALDLADLAGAVDAAGYTAAVLV